MDIEAKMRLLEQNRKDLGTRIAQIPQTYQPPQNDAMLNNLQSQHADAIKQLFAHDSQLSQTTFQPQEAPGPHADGYQAPQGQIIDPLIGQHAAATEQKAAAGQVGDLLNQISNRKNYLEDAYKRGLDLLELGIRAKEAENRMIQTEIENAIKLDEMKQKKSDKKKGEPIPELLKYLIADVGGTNPSNELAASLKAYIAKNPSMSEEALKTGEVFKALGQQESKDKYGFSQDEAAAGVAGQPRTEPWNSMWAKYAKESKKNLSPEEKGKQKFQEEDAYNKLLYPDLYQNEQSSQQSGSSNKVNGKKGAINMPNFDIGNILDNLMGSPYPLNVTDPLEITGFNEWRKNMTTPIKSPIANSGMVYVAKRDTGETGHIPASEFDPNIYVKI